ncbi:hypothetical protein, partial [Rodentibacter trehalosifermentans]
ALFDEATKFLEEELSDRFFKELDRHVKVFFEQQKDWDGLYDFGEQYLNFAPSKWKYQECKEFDYTKYLARYVLYSENMTNDKDTTHTTYYWITCFFKNSENDRMVFSFYNWRPNFKNSHKTEWKKFLAEQINKYPEISNAGFKYISKEAGWYLPIEPLDQNEVIKAFEDDDFEEAFQPITNALETIIETHKYFDNIVEAAIKHFGKAN